MTDRDSARKGKAVEHLVAATCILVSGLELNVSTSFVDDEGVDLVFDAALNSLERLARLGDKLSRRYREAIETDDDSAARVAENELQRVLAEQDEARAQLRALTERLAAEDDVVASRCRTAGDRGREKLPAGGQLIPHSPFRV